MSNSEATIDPLALSNPAPTPPEAFLSVAERPSVNEVDSSAIRHVLDLLGCPMYVQHMGAENAALVRQALDNGDPDLVRIRVSERTVRTLHLEPGPLVSQMLDRWYARLGHDPRVDGFWGPRR